MKFIQSIKEHKIAATIICLLLVGGYYFFSGGGAAVAQPRYVLGEVRKGTLVVSVSGTGQIAAMTQLDIKPKVSGDVVAVPVVEGQTVAAGAPILILDSTDAQKAVRDAQVNLESAQLALDKLRQSSADQKMILQNAFTDISNVFLDFPAIASSTEEIILSDSIRPRSQNNIDYFRDFVGTTDYSAFLKITDLADRAVADYQAAKTSYDDAFAAYKDTSRSADSTDVQRLLSKTTAAAELFAQALKSEQNVLDFLADYSNSHSKSLPTIVASYRSTLRSNVSAMNTHLSTLGATLDTIENAPLDIKSQELVVKQRENALIDAKQTLSYCVVRAPFSGVVAKIAVHRGEPVSSGSAAATMITAQRYAVVSLNEVDVAKVSLGQRTTLSFDAVPELTIAGTVAEIDTIGTISQGVVTYNVKISFDTEDVRVKPGMSVSAAIITNAVSDVLLVPTSAVKNQGESSYVQILDGVTMSSSTQGVVSASAPKQQPVEIGLSNDSMSEIKSGLQEGEVIVTRVITTSAAAAQASGGLGGIRIPGVTGGGNTVRVGNGR